MNNDLIVKINPLIAYAALCDEKLIIRATSPKTPDYQAVIKRLRREYHEDISKGGALAAGLRRYASLCPRRIISDSTV